MKIIEEVTNEGDDTFAFVWGHHPAFPGSRDTVVDMAEAPVITLDERGEERRNSWPTLQLADETIDLSQIGDKPRQALAYLPDVKEAWAAVRSQDRGLGAAIAWDRGTFRHAWIWRDIGSSGFPFYGRSSFVAIEPVSSWPEGGRAAAIARGRAICIQPGETRRAWITLVVLDEPSRPVSNVGADGTVTHAP